MKFFDLFKKRKNNFFSQSGQDQFAYNLSGLDGFYLEIGAHHPTINSNTYKLEKECNWKGISIEYDKSFVADWEMHPERKNKVIWDDAFSVDYYLLHKQIGAPKRINYLSCDIDPTCNTFDVLKKIINEGISFDFISFEHDDYFRKKYTNDTNDYHNLAINFLKKNNYKIAIDDVYPKNKSQNLFETWFINNSIEFDITEYVVWKKLNL